MEAFFIYLAKSAVCLALFSTVYVLFFRHTTFIVFNRVYLMAGLIASLAIPAYAYTYDVHIAFTENLNPVAQAAGQTLPIETNPNLWPVLLYVYLAGVLLFVVRHMVAYRQLTKLIKTGIKQKEKGVTLIKHAQVQNPFTIVNYILFGNNAMTPTEEELIIKHEITHVKQKHWIDLLCSQCMLVLQWFNPIMWLYIRLQKENHEFLADKAVLDGGASPAIYQAVLVNREFGAPVFSFSNSFNYSKPLNRLKMMKKTKSSPIRKIALLTLVPLFGVFLWATAKPQYVITDPTQNSVHLTLAEASHPETDSTRIKVMTVVTSSSGDELTVKTDSENKKESKLYIVGDKGNLSASVQTIVLDLNDSTKTTNKIVFVKPVKSDKAEDKSCSKVDIQVHNTDIPPLLLVDGKEVAFEKIKKIDPNNIESISILKDKSAVETYGERAAWGVIIIETKK